MHSYRALIHASIRSRFSVIPCSSLQLHRARASGVQRSFPIRTFKTHEIRIPLPDGAFATSVYFSGSKKYPIASASAMQDLKTALQQAAAPVDVSASANSTSQPDNPGPKPPRAIFLRSTFAGADLNELRALGGPEEARRFIRVVDALCAAIQDLAVPVVAVIDGPCLGAGMEVASSCDLRIATGRAIFGMPETRMGVASVAQASLIPPLIGWGRARELLYLGAPIDAATALAWGFLNAVVPVASADSAAHVDLVLDRTVNDWAGRFADVAPGAAMTQKALMRTWEERGIGRPGIEAGIEVFGEAFTAAQHGHDGEPKVWIGKHFAKTAAMKGLKTSG